MTRPVETAADRPSRVPSELDADDPPTRLASQPGGRDVVAHLRAGILGRPQGVEHETLGQLHLGIPVEGRFAQPLGREAGFDGAAAERLRNRWRGIERRGERRS